MWYNLLPPKMRLTSNTIGCWLVFESLLPAAWRLQPIAATSEMASARIEQQSQFHQIVPSKRMNTALQKWLTEWWWNYDELKHSKSDWMNYGEWWWSNNEVKLNSNNWPCCCQSCNSLFGLVASVIPAVYINDVSSSCVVTNKANSIITKERE